jgi:hypothetical protein
MRYPLTCEYVRGAVVGLRARVFRHEDSPYSGESALILLAPVVDRFPDAVYGVWHALVLIATSTAIGIAVLRYRLYDIDIVINRTLVYLGGVISYSTPSARSPDRGLSSPSSPALWP